jgi:LPXTG-motif cell wall-anchored protein
VDYDAKEIRLAEVTQNEVTPSPANFASTSTKCGGSGLGTTTVVSIVFGIIIGLTLIGGLAYFLYRRRRKPAHLTPHEQEPQDFHRLHKDHSPVVEANVVDHYPLQHVITEMASERRTSELDNSNGVHPPASPHAPHAPIASPSDQAHILSPLEVATPPHDRDFRRTMGPADVGPSGRSPCNSTYAQ